MRITPAFAFFAILIIGVVAGLIFDRLAGPGWLTRQIAGSRRSIVTASLVGIAGSFIGFNAAVLLAIAPATGWLALVVAAAGAAIVLWLWRIMR